MAESASNHLLSAATEGQATVSSNNTRPPSTSSNRTVENRNTKHTELPRATFPVRKSYQSKKPKISAESLSNQNDVPNEEREEYLSRKSDRLLENQRQRENNVSGQDHRFQFKRKLSRNSESFPDKLINENVGLNPARQNIKRQRVIEKQNIANNVKVSASKEATDDTISRRTRSKSSSSHTDDIKPKGVTPKNNTKKNNINLPSSPTKKTTSKMLPKRLKNLNINLDIQCASTSKASNLSRPASTETDAGSSTPNNYSNISETFQAENDWELLKINTERELINITETGSCVSSGGYSTRSSNTRKSQNKSNSRKIAQKETTTATVTTGTVADVDFAVPSTSSGIRMSENSKGKEEATPNLKVKCFASTSTFKPGNDGASGSKTTKTESTANKSSASNQNLDGDIEFARLQALLETRGLPPKLFETTFGNALGARMQHILQHRSLGGSSSKAHQLLKGLQSQDEIKQLDASTEMCQMLVMGNEDTLAGFPIKEVVPTLIRLLRMEHNFNIMNNACRALAYLLEVLPHSSIAVVDAIPAFLEKLQVIQCMDVAEQSLTALEVLSRRHYKAILQANGVSVCLLYLDFFSMNAQRAAIAITANCCSNLRKEEYHYVKDSLSILERLLLNQDKKCVESACNAFYRLIETFRKDTTILKEIASVQMLKNLQQLLITTPPLLNTITFANAIRMLSILCMNAPTLIITLIQNDISTTLLLLLTGSIESSNSETIEILPRPSSELLEITSLIGELMPCLPTEGIFSIESILEKQGSSPQETSQFHWQWRDDNGTWHSYTSNDSRLIEAAFINSEEEISITTYGVTYSIDFNSMEQINEETGKTRSVQRKLIPGLLSLEDIRNVKNSKNQSNSIPSSNSTNNIHASGNGDFSNSTSNWESLKKEKHLTTQFVKQIFPVLYKVYSSSAGPTVHSKSLKAILRMLYLANGDLLKEVLSNQLISAQIAGMLASKDLTTVISAILMADILIKKLPDTFSIHFCREGVIHQLNRLSDPSIPIDEEPSSSIEGSEACSYASSDVLEPTNFSEMENLSMMASTSRDVTPSSTKTVSKTILPRTSSSSTSTSRSRFAGASSKATAFLSSLNPARWGRSPRSPFSFTKDSLLSMSKHTSNANLAAVGKLEKARKWIHEQSGSFICRYSELINTESHSPQLVLTRLTNALQKLDGDQVDALGALQELNKILLESDISPFEVNHSGLIKTLLHFMSNSTEALNIKDRLRSFLHVFAALPLEENGQITSMDPTSFSTIVDKLNLCVTQLEQFQVKVHDFPATADTRSNTSALKFFNTHQMKCNLQRHPNCTNLRQWRDGPVKIDPLALVQAIERYLVVRGYGDIINNADGSSDDDMDVRNSEPSYLATNDATHHKLQFSIGENVLPYNMTIYQAIKQYSPLANVPGGLNSEFDSSIGCTNMWVQQHVIYYRPVDADSIVNTVKPSISKNLKAVKRKSEFWVDGYAPDVVSPLMPYVGMKLPESVTIQDASTEALCLLRLLNALNRYWSTLYFSIPHVPIINQSEFIHSKIAAKAARQLQDPLVIMTGTLPEWLKQIAYACPFLFPFETRHLIFYVVSFDRDRALQRLLDITPDLNNTVDTAERVTPRLDRRKRTISREDILKQAESIMQDFSHTKALLEIQYDNEVGTGLGPTLEFYSLVSTELKRRDLGLWNDCDSYSNNNFVIEDSEKSIVQPINAVARSTPPKIKRNKRPHSQTTNNFEDKLAIKTSSEPSTSLIVSNQILYVQAPMGLFPTPLSKTPKRSHLLKLRYKFKFLGKFMAKAIWDNRMLDLSFSLPFYRWLLNEESHVGLPDLSQIAPEVHKSLHRLNEVVKQRNMISNDPNIEEEKKQEMIKNLDFDGCLIVDLGLDFILPGHPNIELRRGGKNSTVTIHNLHEYISLVSYWYSVEGVSRQFIALREGFDSVFPTSCLKIFYPEEIESLICGSNTNSLQRWDIGMLLDCCRIDHGYTQDSKAIKNLFKIMSDYNSEEQRLFLQFITGSPRLPTGGFKALTPALTIVQKKVEENESSDDYLPSVMTCVNYLKLPDYTSIEVMRSKLEVAAREGSMSFHLS